MNAKSLCLTWTESHTTKSVLERIIIMRCQKQASKNTTLISDLCSAVEILSIQYAEEEEEIQVCNLAPRVGSGGVI